MPVFPAGARLLRAGFQEPRRWESPRFFRQSANLIPGMACRWYAFRRQCKGWKGALRQSGPAPAVFSRSQSHASLRLMARANCANSIAERLLSAENFPALSSAPLIRASRRIISRGMNLRSYWRATIWEPAGVGFVVITLLSGRDT